MIKQLLFSSLLLLPCAQSMAQDLKTAQNYVFSISSENGKYTCTDKLGIMYLWNTEKDDDVTTFNDQYYTCSSVSNDGVIAGTVGAIGAEKPALITTEGITYLPMPDDREWNYGMARGITSDGKMVCGLLSDGSVSVMDDVTTIYNPQIQIFAESETKRPFFECSFKTKRTKKGLAHNTNNKARNKSQNHSISGFVKHNSTGNIIAFK